MIAAMSPIQNGRPISPSVVPSRLMADSVLADSELGPAELLQLLGEIDKLQLTDLLVPTPGGDPCFGMAQAS